MKWAIAGLVVLGIAAAGCAALLVGAIRAGSLMSNTPKEMDGEVHVLYAKMPLESMSVIDGSVVATKTMKRSEAPKDFIANPVQVVGRVLTVPLLEGQAFSSSCFASDSSASLAAAVGKGKRAVGISVTDYAGLEGLLYPGSVVDVLVTLKPDMNVEDRSTTISAPLTTTLLQRVQVLAIERQSVVSGSADSVGNDVESVSRAHSSRRVTLLVDTKQAKSLQFAMTQGTLSLALRNPLDTGDGNQDQVSMRSILGMPEESARPKGPSALERMFSKAMDAASAAAKAARTKSVASNDPFAKPDAAPQWEVTVIRGESSTKHLFPVPQGESNGNGKSAAKAANADAAGQPIPDVPLDGAEKSQGPDSHNQPAEKGESSPAASAVDAGRLQTSGSATR